MSRGDAWLLLTTAQLRCRDTNLTLDLARDLHRVGRAIQNAVCAPDDQNLHQIAESGWDPASETALASGEHT
ncbi:hypothetical protein [Amycolatopsis sp. NPDC051071]|uniref:hypothetical protein n=1 Tax=Amycolatopsis sp. NPDC051071 TaxID=3154637 RepID=UPI00342105BD